MTNKQFADWRGRHFRSRAAAATGLGMDRDTVIALETGKSRAGKPYPVRPHVALACAAWTMGLREYDGGPVTVG